MQSCEIRLMATARTGVELGISAAAAAAAAAALSSVGRAAEGARLAAAGVTPTFVTRTMVPPSQLAVAPMSGHAWKIFSLVGRFSRSVCDQLAKVTEEWQDGSNH